MTSADYQNVHPQFGRPRRRGGVLQEAGARLGLKVITGT